MSDIKSDDSPNENKGVDISSLVKWNTFLAGIKINEKPLVPFANQLAFLRSTELEVLYGGATRGGKSVAMLMAALQYVDIPGYSAIIFRRTYQELDKGVDALIPMSKAWLMKWQKDDEVWWNSKLFQWEFSSGAVIGFGHLESDNDKFNYIGQSYQFIGFDELTQQPEENYTFLFSRLVRSKELERLGVPLRMRSTTNPNGQHVQWVYDRFVNKRTRPAFRQKIIDEARVDPDLLTDLGRNVYDTLQPEEVPEYYIKYRMPKFIPSLARDNPHLDLRTYKINLAKLDPVTRKQLEEGNWEIRAMGNMFNRTWFERVPFAKVPYYDLKKVRYWDLAATRDGDATACCHLGYDKTEKVFYILDMKIMRQTPREIERTYQHVCFDDGPDTVIYMEKEPGSAGIYNIENFKRKITPPGWHFYEDRVSGDKESRARPLSAAAEKGLIKIAGTKRTDEWFSEVMEQLEMFPEAEHDDAVDALSGAFNMLNHKLNHTAKYIGNVDWLMPSDKEVDAHSRYGPTGDTSVSGLVEVIRNAKKSY
jgi:predicted phage terminase large subunit-like protein